MNKTKKKEKLTPIPKRSTSRRPDADRKATPATPPPAADLSRLSVAISPKVVRTGDLAFLADNPMDHDDQEVEVMREELKTWGQIIPLVINRRPTPPRVVGGNKRLKAMLLDSWETCAVVELDLSEEQEAALAIELNATQGTNWHKDLLQKAMNRIGSLNLGEVRDKLISRLAEAKHIIPRTGGGSPGAAEAPEPQIDRAAELQKKWGTAQGDLWEVRSKAVPGKCHRLLCGDSTDPKNIERLMGVARAGLCFTSPPYAQQRDYTKKIDDWDALMQGVFGNLPMADDGQVLVNLGIFYRNGEWVDYWSPWVAWMKDNGWRSFGWYVWDKINGAPGDWVGRCAPCHEWVFHFNRKSREVNTVPKKPQSIKLKTSSSLRYPDGSLHTANYSPESGLNSHKIPDSVWRFHVACTTGKVEVNHPAVFPVSLPGFAIEAFTEEGSTVYEPFCGSGTTIVAAEQTGRICMGLELEPKYCGVILERLSGCGLEPRKVSA